MFHTSEKIKRLIIAEYRLSILPILNFTALYYTILHYCSSKGRYYLTGDKIYLYAIEHVQYYPYFPAASQRENIFRISSIGIAFKRSMKVSLSLFSSHTEVACLRCLSSVPM